MKKIVVLVIITLAALGFGVLLFIKDGKTQQQAAAPFVAGDFSQIPRSAQLLGNLKSAGLDALNSEGTVLHIHQHLDLIINGQNTQIPANIGVSTNFISPIHTHDTSGILHVESPVKKDFKLSQFFTEWGIAFNSNCIAAYCADSGHKLVVGVNGKTATDLQNIVLNAHDEIEVWYGPASQTPDLIKTFAFPEGE